MGLSLEVGAGFGVFDFWGMGGGGAKGGGRERAPGRGRTWRAPRFAGEVTGEVRLRPVEVGAAGGEGWGLEGEAAEQLDLAWGVDDAGGAGRRSEGDGGVGHDAAGAGAGDDVAGDALAGLTGRDVGEEGAVDGEDVAVVDDVEGFGGEFDVHTLAEEGEGAGDAGVEVVDAWSLEGVAGDDLGGNAAGSSGVEERELGSGEATVGDGGGG